jgi:non-specific serine/threonine protein kinase/serine/threonine-protein kinase
VTARDLRGDLDVITLKALKKDPSRRYATVEQLSEDLARYESGRPVLARPDSWQYRAGKFVARHKTAAAAAALVTISLVAGILTTSREARIASAERARAERRFNDVRRLANSVLFEFHDAIAPLPGSTKVRELLVQRATEYLDSLTKESSNDPSLQRELASAYDRVGDVQGLPAFSNLGNTAAALESHRRALALREPLAAASNAEPAVRAELVTTLWHLTSISEELSDLPNALAYARRAQTACEAFLAKNPNGLVERRQVAISYQLIGGVLANMQDIPASLEARRRAADAFASLLMLDPANRDAQRSLSIAYKYLGATLETSGDVETALSSYRKAVALDESRVASAPNDTLSKLDLSFGYASMGFTLSRRGKIDESLDNYRRALALREAAAAADPHDVNARDAVTRAHLSIGQVLRGANRHAEAMAEFHVALREAEARHVADPVNRAVEERLANIYGALAGTETAMASAATNTPAALPLWREAREWTRKAVDIWKARQTLTGAQKEELASLASLADKCDAAMAKLTRVSKSPPLARASRGARGGSTPGAPSRRRRAARLRT